MVDALKQLKSIPGYEDIPEYAEKAKELEAQIDSFNSIITLLTGNSAAIGGMETYLNTVSSGMESLAGGAAELKTQYETFDEAINTLSGTLTGLAGNMTTLKGGIDELIASISGDETETVSFVSEKNTNVDSVQFVIKTAAVEKEEVEQAEETETQPTGFWQKLLQLFGK